MTQKTPDLSAFIPPGWEGKLPPCQIQVNTQGELYHNGAPLIHPGILELIYQAVRYQDGVYLLEMDGKRCQLEVADTFWVVRSLDRRGDTLLLTLNDGNQEELDPSSLWIGPQDVIYCRVKGGLPARFTRQAYYQLAAFIEEDGDGFALRLGERSYPLTHGEKP